MVLRVLQLRGPELRVVWAFMTARPTPELRLVGPVDKQVILGDVSEFHEVGAQGPWDRSMRYLRCRDSWKLTLT